MEGRVKQVRAEMDGLLCAPMRMRKAQKSRQDAEKSVEKANEHHKESLRLKESSKAALAAAHGSVDCEEDGDMKMEERDPDGEIQQVSPHAPQTQGVLDVHRIDALSSKLDLLCSSLLSQSNATGNASPGQRTLFQFFSRSAHEREERNDDISPMNQTRHAEICTTPRQRASSADRVVTGPFRVEGHRYNPM